jgi:ATP-binding cassette subfamily B protein
MANFPSHKDSAGRSALYNVLCRLWVHLGVRRQRQIGLLLILMIISAFAEAISLGAVLPFIGVLISPEQLFRHAFIADMARAWGITSVKGLVLPLTIMFVTAALFAAALRMLLLWGTTRLAFATSADLSLKIYRRTLYQPYQVHIGRNSSEVISSVTYKVHVAATVLHQVLAFVSSVVLMAAVMFALLAINTVVAIVATISVGVAYALITWLFRKRLKYNADLIARGSTQTVKALQEGLGAIRDVLLDGTQPVYCQIYHRADHPVRVATGNNIFIGGAPRFAMEAVGMVLIAILAYNLSLKADGVASALPVLGALALGAQRLLPALQQMYAAWTIIAGCETSLIDTLELLDQPLPADALLPIPAPLSFQEDIVFDSVGFRYVSDGPSILNDFNLCIPKSSRVGLVGNTGSGKSTTLDLLMTLIEPTTGSILVDGMPLKGERRRAWQRTIAHVPQSIYLADTTLAENIAFGVPRESIDMDRVRVAAQQAQIADFIEGRLQGYEALVGERGVSLSGGQRQRIGIARALYKQATVLVFDEATSALDNSTEQQVMDAIQGLNPDITIIIVAHRLTTVKRCDIIVELRHGKVVAQGTYDDLLESSPTFRSMAQAVE